MDLEGPETSRVPWLAAAGLLLAGIAVLDYVTGYEVALSLFYLIPIAVAAWEVGLTAGLVFSVASAATWGAVDYASGHRYSTASISVWNSAIRLGFFVIVTTLLADRRKLLRREGSLARTDFLTGIANSRHLFDQLNMELGRCARYGRPVSLAYIDLDDFKRVNDRDGHAAGDRVLKGVAEALRALLRREDLVARVGGDEFAVILPESGAAAAAVVGRKLHAAVRQVQAAGSHPVTCSIGVVTCVRPPASGDDFVRMADSLMYEVKQKGKDAVACSVYTG
jgi:diguanylate cyclase (GGDEF)-like protein